MADPKNDITTSIEANDADVADLKKAHYIENAGATRLAVPNRVAQVQPGLNAQLLNMITLGKTYASFGGIDRCIRVLDAGTNHAHHCGSMMVKNLTTNQLMCSSCDKIKDPNANPKVINSSMIRLNQKELEECGLKEDPFAGRAVVPAQPAKAPAKKAQKARENAEVQRPKKTMKTPNKVVIEMTMEELKNDPNVVNVMLNKTLEAIFELPVSNFREAEAIRVVKERVESFLKGDQNG